MKIHHFGTAISAIGVKRSKIPLTKVVPLKAEFSGAQGRAISICNQSTYGIDRDSHSSRPCLPTIKPTIKTYQDLSNARTNQRAAK